MARNRKIKWDEKGGLLLNARRELPRLIAAYFSQVREVLAKDGSPRKLHKLRLASKRLRYTLELFRPCYPAGLEDRLDTLRKLQDSLGEVNDAVASARLLREPLKRHPKLRKFLDDRAEEQAKEFARHWKETFDAPGREAWWTDFMAHHSIRKVTRLLGKLAAAAKIDFVPLELPRELASTSRRNSWRWMSRRLPRTRYLIYRTVAVKI
jgi:hypothetical protein